MWLLSIFELRRYWRQIWLRGPTKLNIIIIIIIIVSSSLQYNNNNNNNNLRSLLLLCLELQADKLRTVTVVASSLFNTSIICNSFTLVNHNTRNFVQIST
jgi:hypothetical protein